MCPIPISEIRKKVRFQQQELFSESEIDVTPSIPEPKKRWGIKIGDVREVLSACEENSFHACFCDPPYGLNFMGKTWDGQVPDKSVWEEVLRVLKPGAFLLAFGGTRTFHRLMCAIEDAGFQIRDTCSWNYGSGFPKSHNISKGLDRKAGKEREVVGVKPGHEEFANRETRGHIDRKGATEGFDRPWMHDSKKRKQYHLLTAPATFKAEQWEGYGTALKPSWEPLIVAMKPLDGTFVQNALEHGVAGLNIDGCRIGAQEQGRWPANLVFSHHPECALIGEKKAADCHPDCAVKQLDDQTGILKSGGYPPEGGQRTHQATYGKPSKHGERKFTTSEGGASRFFYCSQITEAEKQEWNCHPDCAVKQLDDQTGILKSGGGNKRPSDRSRYGGNSYNQSATLGDDKVFDKNEGGASRFFYCAKVSRKERGEGNNHPTVKPQKLIEYFAKLILPPDLGEERKILVPFSGSGSEMIGSLQAGWDFAYGVEISEEYIQIAENRLTERDIHGCRSDKDLS